MKRQTVILFFVTLCLSQLFAQSPKGFNYQAVVRNSAGQIMANHEVNVHLSILQGSETGTAVYSYNNHVQSNANGIITIHVGENSADYAAINWANGPYFLNCEIDPNNGNNFSLSTTQQILSVPYSEFAAVADRISSSFVYDEQDPLFRGWGYLYDSLVNAPTRLSQFVNDLNYLTENGLQLTLSGDTLFITGGDYVVLPQNGITSLPWDSVTGHPTLLSQFVNDLNLSDLTNDLTFSLNGDTLVFGNSQVLLHITGTDSIFWTDVYNRPTRLSDFINDLLLSSITNDMSLSSFTNDLSLSDFVNDLLFSVAGDTLYYGINRYVVLPKCIDTTVGWANIIGRPTSLSQFANDMGYITGEVQGLSDVLANDNNATLGITGLPVPVADSDAVNKRYADSTAASVIASVNHRMDSINSENDSIAAALIVALGNYVDSLKRQQDSMVSAIVATISSRMDSLQAENDSIAASIIASLNSTMGGFHNELDSTATAIISIIISRMDSVKYEHDLITASIIASLNSRIDSLQAANSSSTSSIVASLNSRMDSLLYQHDSITAAIIASLSNRIDSLQAANNSTTASLISSLNNRMDSLLYQRDSVVTSIIGSLSSRIDSLQAANEATISFIIASLTSRMDSLMNSHDSISTMVFAALNSRIDSLKAENDSTTAAIVAALNSRMDSIQAQNDSTTAAIVAAISSRMDSLHASNDSLAAAIAALNSRINGLHAEIDSTAASIVSTISNRIDSILYRYDSIANAVLAALNHQIDSLQNELYSLAHPVIQGCLLSHFSVGNNKQIMFSKGNLQYNPSLKLFRFADQQYTISGVDNTYISSTANVWLDLFAYGTSGWDGGRERYLPYETNTISNQYMFSHTGDDLTGIYVNADWGEYNRIINGSNQYGMWRTITNQELNYIINERTNAENLKTFATVNSVKGLILLPDNWIAPSGVTISSFTTSDYDANIFDDTQWQILESAGAVFLPAAGKRLVGTLVGEGDTGYYWTSTHSNGTHSRSLNFDTAVGSSMTDTDCSWGCSVRLVRDY